MKKLVRKNLAVFIIILALVMLPLCYILLSRPEIIDTGIAKLSKTFSDHSSSVWAVKFSPDGNMIASCSVDSTVIIRETVSGSILKRLKHPAGLTNLDFSPDGKLIVTSSYDAKVRIWEVGTGNLAKIFNGHEGTVWTVAWSPDGKTVAGAGEDKVIITWDIASGNILHKLAGHSRNIWTIKFSPDGTELASGSFDNKVKIWDVAKGEIIRTLSGHTEAIVDLAYSHDGKWLVTTSDDETIKIWSLPGYSLSETLEVGEHQQAVAFSPDDKRLLSGGHDHSMAGELLQNFTGGSKRFKGISARLWDFKTMKVIQTFNTHANDVNDVAFSRDGLWFATASEDCTVDLWQVEK